MPRRPTCNAWKPHWTNCATVRASKRSMPPRCAGAGADHRRKRENRARSRRRDTQAGTQRPGRPGQRRHGTAPGHCRCECRAREPGRTAARHSAGGCGPGRSRAVPGAGQRCAIASDAVAPFRACATRPVASTRCPSSSATGRRPAPAWSAFWLATRRMHASMCQKRSVPACSKGRDSIFESMAQPSRSRRPWRVSAARPASRLTCLEWRRRQSTDLPRRARARRRGRTCVACRPAMPGDRSGIQMT